MKTPHVSSTNDAEQNRRAEEVAAHLVREGRPRDAAELLEAAIAQNESADLWNDWATAQHCCGNTEQTERGYRRALKLDASHRQSSVNLGFFLVSQGRLEEGLPLIENHKNTLTEQERQAVRDLAARLRQQKTRRSADTIPSAPASTVAKEPQDGPSMKLRQRGIARLSRMHSAPKEPPCLSVRNCLS